MQKLLQENRTLSCEKTTYCLLSIWKLTNGFSVISANKSSLMELKVFPKKCSSKRKCENSIYKNVNLQFDKRLGFVSSFLSPQLKSIHFDSRWGLSTIKALKGPFERIYVNFRSEAAVALKQKANLLWLFTFEKQTGLFQKFVFITKHAQMLHLSRVVRTYIH